MALLMEMMMREIKMTELRLDEMLVHLPVTIIDKIPVSGSMEIEQVKI